MLEKILDLPLMAFIAVTGLVRDLRKDERGLSGVVVAIMLILVAILAVILIWTFLGTWIRDMWDSITQKSNVS